MAGTATSRWPAVTGLWLGLGTWLYAVLASLELRGLDYDPTRPGQVGYDRVAAYVPGLTYATALGLGVALLVGAASITSDRGRRGADAVLGVGLAVGAWLLWALEDPRPVLPLLVAAAALVALVAALLPPRPEAGPAGAFLARLLLVAAALVSGWVVSHELAEFHWQVRSWTAGYYLGLVVAAAMLLAAVLGRRLAHPVLRWSLGLPLLLLALAALAASALGFAGGVLVSGFEEYEDGWRLGAPAAFLGAGLLATAVALLRRRWTLAVGTLGGAVLVTLAVVFGVPEVRSGF